MAAAQSGLDAPLTIQVLVEELRRVLDDGVFSGEAATCKSYIAFPDPQLEVKSQGSQERLPIALPLSPLAASAIRHAASTSVAKGSDPSTTAAFKPDAVRIANPEWERYLHDTIVPDVIQALFFLPVDPTATKIKLRRLILEGKDVAYPPDDDPTSIGLLTVVLPAESFEGGEVRISNDDGTTNITLSTASSKEPDAAKIQTFAWYNGLNCHAKELRSGCRLVLEYTLHHEYISMNGPVPTLRDVLKPRLFERLLVLLRAWRTNYRNTRSHVAYLLPFSKPIPSPDDGDWSLGALLCPTDRRLIQVIEAACRREGFYLFVGNMEVDPPPLLLGAYRLKGVYDLNKTFVAERSVYLSRPILPSTCDNSSLPSKGDGLAFVLFPRVSLRHTVDLPLKSYSACVYQLDLAAKERQYSMCLASETNFLAILMELSTPEWLNDASPYDRSKVISETFGWCLATWAVPRNMEYFYDVMFTSLNCAGDMGDLDTTATGMARKCRELLGTGKGVHMDNLWMRAFGCLIRAKTHELVSIKQIGQFEKALALEAPHIHETFAGFWDSVCMMQLGNELLETDEAYSRVLDMAKAQDFDIERVEELVLPFILQHGSRAFISNWLAYVQTCDLPADCPLQFKQQLFALFLADPAARKRLEITAKDITITQERFMKSTQKGALSCSMTFRVVDKALQCGLGAEVSAFLLHCVETLETQTEVLKEAVLAGYVYGHQDTRSLLYECASALHRLLDNHKAEYDPPPPGGVALLRFLFQQAAELALVKPPAPEGWRRNPRGCSKECWACRNLDLFLVNKDWKSWTFYGKQWGCDHLKSRLDPLLCTSWEDEVHFWESGKLAREIWVSIEITKNGNEEVNRLVRLGEANLILLRMVIELHRERSLDRWLGKEFVDGLWRLVAPKSPSSSASSSQADESQPVPTSSATAVSRALAALQTALPCYWTTDLKRPSDEAIERQPKRVAREPSEDAAYLQEGERTWPLYES